MKAVIQAGGKGTRLHNITKDEIPKPMVKIAGRPLLHWQIEALANNGILDIYIIIGHLGHIIQNYFEDGCHLGVHITYIEEQEPLGSAGGLYFFKKYISAGEDVLLLYGDIFFDINISQMYQFHLKKQAVLTVFAHPNAHPQDSDLLEVNSQQEVTGFVSKKEKRVKWFGNLVNAAVYILKGQVICEIGKPEKLDFEKDILWKLVKIPGTVYAYRSTEYVKDAGTVERLKSIEKNIQSGCTERRNLRNIQKCIFFDLDGMLFKSSPAFIAGVADTLKMVNGSEFLSVVISCPMCSPIEMFPVEDIEMLYKKLQTLLGEYGAYFDDAIFYMPVKGEKKVLSTGTPSFNDGDMDTSRYSAMVLDMAVRHRICFYQSWMVSSTWTGIEVGRDVGMNTVFIADGMEIEGETTENARLHESLLLEVEKILDIQ